MRENVVGEIRAMITKLNGEENIDPQQIDTLIKKIIVTTDAQSAKALNKPDTPAKSADQANEPSLFAGLKQIASQQLDGEGNPISLTQKVKNGASLVKENLSISEDNPNTLKVLIDSATNFANQASGDNSSQLTAFKKSLEKVVIIFSDNEAIEQNWKAPDERSFLDKAKKANAIKSMPVVNQIPVVNKVLAGTSRTVQLTTAGVAGSTIQVANVTAAAGIVAGKKVAAGAEFTGRQVAAGAKATGNAVAAGAEFTGRQVAAGAKATGNAVAAGAKATGNAVTAGAKATGNAVAAGAKATGNAVAAGAKATAKGASVAGKGALVGATYALGATAVVVAAPVLLGAATVGLPAYGAYKGIKSTM